MTRKQRIKFLSLRLGGSIVDAEKAYDVLEGLRRKGRLTAAAVLDAARDPASPLYKAFEWDDGQAAEAYRRMQARGIIRAVVTVPDDPKEEPRRVYVHVPAADGPEGDRESSGRYERGEIVAKSLDMFKEAMAEALRDVRSAQQRVSDLRFYAGEREHGEEQMALIALIASSLATAETAIQRLH